MTAKQLTAQSLTYAVLDLAKELREQRDELTTEELAELAQIERRLDALSKALWAPGR